MTKAPSVVIYIINVPYIATSKAKNHTPVRAYGHRPQSFEFAFERVQPEARQIQMSLEASRRAKNVAQLSGVFDHSARRHLLREGDLRPLWRMRPDHTGKESD